MRSSGRYARADVGEPGAPGCWRSRPVQGDHTCSGRDRSRRWGDGSVFPAVSRRRRVSGLSRGRSRFSPASTVIRPPAARLWQSRQQRATASSPMPRLGNRQLPQDLPLSLVAAEPEQRPGRLRLTFVRRQLPHQHLGGSVPAQVATVSELGGTTLLPEPEGVPGEKDGASCDGVDAGTYTTLRLSANLGGVTPRRFAQVLRRGATVALTGAQVARRRAGAGRATTRSSSRGSANWWARRARARPGRGAADPRGGPAIPRGRPAAAGRLESDHYLRLHQM